MPFARIGAPSAIARSLDKVGRAIRWISAPPLEHAGVDRFVDVDVASVLTLCGFIAPMLLDGPMNGECFRAWIEQMLAPALEPGDVVVMDNLSGHKVAGVRQAIEQRGATLLYLPPYSPDLNPIENGFAKLKALVRKAAARTIDALEAAAADAISQFTPAECANFFAHAGYGSD